jgi:cephalosporin-C deacetylase
LPISINRLTPSSFTNQALNNRRLFILLNVNLALFVTFPPTTTRIMRPLFLLLLSLGLGTLNAANVAPAPATPKAATAPAAAAIKLSVTTDRIDAIYRSGETATFTITSTPASDETVLCTFSKDGIQAQPAQKVALKNGRATINGTLNEPGFLRLQVTSGGGTSQALGGAAYDPLDLKPSMPVPDDFDQFWNAQKEALKKVPLKFTLTPVPAPATLQNVDTFDVQVDALGAPVSGYLSKPKNALPKSLPAILFVHGAGVQSASLANTTHWAEKEGGMLAMDINAHGIPNGKPKDYYVNLSQNELLNYRAVGNRDRETNYFKGMFLRLIRAIDFLTAQPEWDGKTVIVYGSSQGGYQALAASGLDPRVTFLCAGVPAGCDHTGSQANRVNGWPKMVPLSADGTPDPVALETSRYVDAVNFAVRAQAKGAALTVGFIDVTCPPTSVYAAYNALSIPKSLYTSPLTGHSNTPEGTKFMQEAALQHVRDMKSASQKTTP